MDARNHYQSIPTTADFGHDGQFRLGVADSLLSYLILGSCGTRRRSSRRRLPFQRAHGHALKGQAEKVKAHKHT